VWTKWRRENSWPYRDSNSDPSVVQPVTIRYTDYAIPAPIFSLYMPHYIQYPSVTLQYLVSEWLLVNCTRGQEPVSMVRFVTARAGGLHGRNRHPRPGPKGSPKLAEGNELIPFSIILISTLWSLFNLLSLFWKLKGGLWNHLAVCVSPYCSSFLCCPCLSKESRRLVLPRTCYNLENNRAGISWCDKGKTMKAHSVVKRRGSTFSRQSTHRWRWG
jgi:hypothetical protein